MYLNTKYLKKKWRDKKWTALCFLIGNSTHILAQCCGYLNFKEARVLWFLFYIVHLKINKLFNNILNFVDIFPVKFERKKYRLDLFSVHIKDLKNYSKIALLIILRIIRRKVRLI